MNALLIGLILANAMPKNDEKVWSDACSYAARNNCTISIDCAKPPVCPPAPVQKPKKVIRKKKAVKKATTVTKPAKIEVKKEIEPAVIVGGRIALGAGLRVPNGPELQAGVRVHVPKFRLGLDVATSFAFGTGAAVLVYPWQGEKLNWHINAGVLGTGNQYLSTTDVPRTWDLTLGTGIEYRVHRHISLTADYRAAIPSPVFIVQHDSRIPGSMQPYLDSPMVLGNSFTQGHFLVGVMFRN